MLPGAAAGTLGAPPRGGRVSEAVLVPAPARRRGAMRHGSGRMPVERGDWDAACVSRNAF
jgi:hypothetical protein